MCAHMETNVKIRQANYRDYRSLCEVFASVNRTHVELRSDLYREVPVAIPKWKYCLAVFARDIIGYQPVSLLVAECEGRILGAVFVQSISRGALSWSAFPKEAYLDNIVVVEDSRRQGIGRALLNAALDWANDTGHKHIWAKVVENNEPSKEMFREAGFRSDCVILGRHLPDMAP